MAEATHNATESKELEGRMTIRLESRLMELVGWSMQKTLGDYLKDQIQELVKLHSDDVHGNSTGVNSRGD